MKNIIKITAVATVGILGLAACGDVSGDELRDSLIDDGMGPEAAQCVVDFMEDNMSEDDFQDAATADTAEEMSEEAFGVVTEALVECDVL